MSKITDTFETAASDHIEGCEDCGLSLNDLLEEASTYIAGLPADQQETASNHIQGLLKSIVTNIDEGEEEETEEEEEEEEESEEEEAA